MNRIKVKIKDHQIVEGKPDLRDMFRTSKDGTFAIEKKIWSGMKTYKQIKAVKGVVVPAYADYIGETLKKAERNLKEDYGITEYDTNKKGELCMIYKSFSDYTKDEMRAFIEGTLNHLEHDCNFIIDLETRKKLQIDLDTGELTES